MLERPPKNLLRAIGCGLLAPMVIAPIAWIVLLQLSRPFPQFGELVFGTSGNMFNALVPESSYKGLVVPFLLVLSPPVFLGDLGAAALTWRMLRSKKLAAVTLATSILVQLAFVVAVCALLEFAA